MTSSTVPNEPPAILVVEDDAIIAWDIALQLRSLGYRALGPAATGARVFRRPLRAEERERFDEHFAPVAIRKGRNSIAVRNRITGPGGGSFHLRLNGITLERTTAPRSELRG